MEVDGRRTERRLMEVDGYGLGSWKLEAPVEAKKQQKQVVFKQGAVAV